ncbi:uncharacterized protein LOC125024678 isoform X2 [Penaeus chinensis]|uniref:uncharacterized protein LOC125024678 isoform X2 n=1 Tax=Penaeus chinensis TaxID=139456 RepID=UPI001FB5A2C5|nr:uncharacterized protein LOC125024678 isoform X2 [Penaeus chinensis]
MPESGDATRSRPPQLGSLSTLGVTWTPAPEARGYPLQPSAFAAARPTLVTQSSATCSLGRPPACRSRPRPSTAPRF